MIMTGFLFAVLLGLMLLFLVINALYTARAAYYLRKIEPCRVRKVRELRPDMTATDTLNAINLVRSFL